MHWRRTAKTDQRNHHVSSHCYADDVQRDEHGRAGHHVLGVADVFQGRQLAADADAVLPVHADLEAKCGCCKSLCRSCLMSGTMCHVCLLMTALPL